jgi:hypothetical protein
MLIQQAIPFEANTTQDYTVKVFTLVLVNNNAELAMLSDAYTNSGANVSDTRINNLNNGDNGLLCLFKLCA